MPETHPEEDLARLMGWFFQFVGDHQILLYGFALGGFAAIFFP